jgi:hypothetical protein
MIVNDPSEALRDDLFDLRIEAIARARTNTPRKNYISLKEMSAFVDKLFDGRNSSPAFRNAE